MLLLPPRNPRHAAPGSRRRQSAQSRNELRLAAIDVGSNSIHMVIAQVDAGGGISELWRGAEMVGLGRNSFPSHRLSRSAIDRAMLTLARFLSEARRWECEELVAIATSAVREAENGGEFIEAVRAQLGVHVRVVSAREESRLIYLGVRQATDLRKGPHLIVDLGGGSAEFIVGDNEKPLLLESRKLGAARMTARFVRSDPVEAREIKALLAHYDAEMSSVLRQVRELRPVRIIGTSGSIESLATMCASDEQGPDVPKVLSRTRLEKMIGRLVETTQEERAEIRGLDEKRRDQILAAALFVQELMKRLNVDQLEVCRSALREGMLVDYLARHRPELEVRRESPNPRRRAVLDLGRRCHWQREHAEQVARLCLELFDHLQSLHHLDRRQRELIEYGALLHDIGYMIGRNKHHKHTMYLILHGDLKPFSRNEIRTIACIARYHRKSFPKKSDPMYAALPRPLRRAVKVGAALLRIADGLDRTSCSLVEDLVCRIRPRQVDILVNSRGDAELELWSARTRSRLFQKVFRKKIAFQSTA